MPKTPESFIWIQDAAREYGVSRDWLDRQIAENRLSVGHVPGDRRVFLLRNELDELTRPRITPREQQDAG